MATATATRSGHSGARAKEALFDELVERLASVEDEAERLRAELQAAGQDKPSAGIDPVWRSIANDLAGALRPYTMFREQTLDEGRIVVHTRVAGSTLHAASAALERYARYIAVESYRRESIPVPEDGQSPAEDEPERKAA